MIPKHVFDIRWPRFSFYPPLAMGLIHPEWLYLHHYPEEEEDEKNATLENSLPLRPKVNFRPRPPFGK
ncbi:hypothetical protein [Salinithrix halophila]|uniref:hypothetical protein n=1 Tax=Salinithrix halophila TaxID=1485204 RepID=UPI0036D2F6AF